MSRSMHFKSQYRQDEIVDILLNHKTEGFFLDIGAYDGVNFSNSYYFEKERNWKGICVEPIPNVFKNLSKNRNCILINGAISETEGDTLFVHVTGFAEMLSGIKKFRNEEHQIRTKREITRYGGTINNIICRTYNINSLLQKHNITAVDYLSIDIEGGELEVLNSINFKKHYFKLITVENNYNDEKLKHFMKTKGFFYLFKYGSDDFYSTNKLRGFRLLFQDGILGKSFLKNYLNTYLVSKWFLKILKRAKVLHKKKQLK